MREIVNIQIGSCGNHIGTSFWETISDEHGIDRSGYFNGESEIKQSGAGVYFDEVQSGRYVPRAVLIDLEPGTLDSMRATPLGHLFKSDNYVFGKYSAGNNWGKGFYTEGAKYIESALDVIRQEVEISDTIQGFQITHALGGGTGSGMGSLLMERLQEIYPDVLLHSYPIYPSPSVSDIVVEPYNTVFATSKLIENCSSTFVCDNAALHQICSKYLDLKQPTYSDLNHLVVQVMSSTTSSFRYPGQLNSSLRKHEMNMIPFPRLHFLTTSLAPCTSKNLLPYRTLSVQDLVQQMLSEKNVMCNINIKHGRSLTGYSIFRGNVSSNEVEKEMNSAVNKGSSYYIEWIPNNNSSSICNIPPKGYNTAALFLRNTTSIQTVFKVLSEQFTYMFRKKAYIHWYLSEGMDEMEFTEAESCMNDLVSEFQSGDNNYNDEDYEWQNEEE